MHVYIFIDLSYVQDFVHYSIIYERLNCAIFGVVGILPLNYHMPYQNYLWVLEDLKLHCAIYNESMIYNLYICRCRLWLDIGTCCFKYVGTGSGTFFFTVFVWAHVLVHFFYSFCLGTGSGTFFLQFLFGHRFWYNSFLQFLFGHRFWYKSFLLLLFGHRFWYKSFLLFLFGHRFWYTFFLQFFY